MSTACKYFDEKVKNETERKIDEKLQSLKVYIPFIDYLYGLNNGKYEKMLCIKRWILDNKRYSLDILSKFEEAICVQYRNLLLEDVKIPSNIYNIFNKNGSTTYEQINLCSDDEQTDDDGIIFSNVDKASNEQYQSKSIDSTKKTNSKEVHDRCSSPPNVNHKERVSLQSIDISCNTKCDIAADRETQEKISCINNSEEKTHSPISSTEVINLCSDDEHLDDDDNVISTHDDMNTSLCSQDTTTSNIIPIPLNNANLKISPTVCPRKSDSENLLSVNNDTDDIENLFTRRPHTSRKSPVVEEQVDCVSNINNQNDNFKSGTGNEVSMSTECTSQFTDQNKTFIDDNLERMNYEQLKLMYEKLSGNNPKILEEMLSNLVMKTSSDNLTSPTTTFESVNGNRFNESHAFPNNACSNLTSERYQSTHNSQAQGYELHSQPQQQQLRYSAGTTLYPNGKKLNLKDPRIVRQLKILQNSPVFPVLYPEIVQSLTNNIIQPSNNTVCQSSLLNKSNDQQYMFTEVNVSHAPITYGEYKRQKAERAMNVERCKQFEQRKNFTHQNIIDFDEICDKETSLMTNKLNKSNEKVENQAVNNFHSNLHESEIRVETVKVSDNSVQPKKKRKSRALKELECTLTGFNEIQDYLLKSSSGKRKSSEHARSAIYKQLNIEEINVLKEKQSSKSIKSKTRRSSFSFDMQNTATEASSRISQRRKSINEIGFMELTPKKLSKRRNTVTCIKTHEPTYKKFKENERNSSNTDVEPKSIELKENEKKSNKTEVEYFKKFRTQPVVLLNRVAMPNVKQSKKVDETNSEKSIPQNAHPLDNEKHNQPTINSESENIKTRINTSIETDSAKSSTAPISKRRKTITDMYPIEDESQMINAKILALYRQPIVLVERLTESEISKHTLQSKTPSEMTLNVELIEINRRIQSTTAPKVRRKSVTDMKKNIDREMTERNTTYCALCKAKPHNIVNHYVRSHKTEPYVSRLTTPELEDLQMNCPFAAPCHSPEKSDDPCKYKVQCIFCKNYLTDSFINLYMHFSTHTGEYSFQCSHCKLLKPYRSNITHHKKQNKTCRNARINTMYQYRSNAMVIHLHCCTFCNFVQLNEANVFKHVRDHHNKMDENPFYVQKYIIAAINDAEIVNEILPVEDTALLEESTLVENENNSEEKECIIDECKPELLSEELLDVQGSTYSIESDKILETNKQCMTVVHTPLSPTAPSSQIKKREVILKPVDDADLPRPIVIKCEGISASTEKTSYMPEKINSQYKDLIDASHISKDIVRPAPHPTREYRHYPNDMKCLGIFKCMAVDCFFSSNKDNEILEHLNDHKTSDCPPIGYLQCSYCDFFNEQCDDPEDLIEHVYLKHFYSRYQCGRCSYRSCLPENTSIHNKIAHGIGTDFVYECFGSSLSVDEKLTELNRLMLENIQKFKCFYCYQTFKNASLLWQHLQNIHNIKSNEIIQEYSCIFCIKNVVDEKTMREHLALSHPDELAYTCRRVLSKTLEDGFVVNLTLCDINTALETNIISGIDCNTNAIHNSNMAEPSEINDSKPSTLQLEKIDEEILRSLIYKHTTKTGISPDRLYQCPYLNCGGFFSTYILWSRHMTLRHNSILARCPHCHNQEEFELKHFKEHFEEHRQHTYVCFNCGETFRNENSTIEHFQNIHDIKEFRIEKIIFNICYSYHIILAEDDFKSRLDFLQKLRQIMMHHLEEVEQRRIEMMSSKWNISEADTWIENYPVFYTLRKCLRKCLSSQCDYKTLHDEELFQHLKTKHTIKELLFKCSKCRFQINKCNNWNTIIDHIRMHNGNIYICCVCSYYHFDRQTLSEHVQNQHNSRDVPFLTLYRSINGTHVGVGVIFASGKKTFSTKSPCFLCKDSNFIMESYSKHLRNAHNLFLKYFCEICQVSYKKLNEVTDHFNNVHKYKDIKINCQFVTNNQLSVCSVQPLTISINHTAIAYNTHKCKNSEQLENAELSTAKQIKIENSDGNESDSSIEILEDEDIIFQEEYQTRRNEQNASKANIKCIDFKNLC